MANGSRHSLMMVRETVTGQTPDSPKLQILRNTGVTLGLTKDALESAEIRDDRMTAEMRLGANQVGGEINFELSCVTYDDMLRAVLLSPDWAPVAGKPDRQMIKVGQERQSFSFVRYFGDLEGVNAKPYFFYTGCELSQFKMTVAANAMVKGSFTVFGQGQTIEADMTSVGTPTTVPPTSTPQLDAFTGELKEKGNTIAVITEIQLNLDNGIAARFVVGQKNSIKPSLARAKVTGQVTAYFEDTTLLERYLNEENSSIEFDLPDGQGSSLTFNLPNIKFTGGKPDVSGEGPITLSMPFTALMDPVTKTNLIVTRNKPVPALTGFKLTGGGVVDTNGGVTAATVSASIATDGTNGKVINLAVEPALAAPGTIAVTVKSGDETKATATWNAAAKTITVKPLVKGSAEVTIASGSVSKKLTLTVVD